MTLVDEQRQATLLKAAASKIRKKQAGGSAANSIVALAQFGGKGFYSCKVASDEEGVFYQKDLVAQGVDTNLTCGDLEGGQTGKCLVMVSPDAERTMNTFLGISSSLSSKEVIPEVLKNSNFLFIEGYLVTSETGFVAIKEAKEFAQLHGVKVSLTFSDPSMVKYFASQITELIGDGVDLLFCNEEEAMLYTSTADCDAAILELKKITKSFVLTKGSQGAQLWDGDILYEVAANKVAAVDTTGAGDIYAGAFLYGINNGLSYPDSGKLASLVAAKIVSQYGPRLSKSEIMEVLELLNNKK